MALMAAVAMAAVAMAAMAIAMVVVVATAGAVAAARRQPVRHQIFSIVSQVTTSFNRRAARQISRQGGYS